MKAAVQRQSFRDRDFEPQGKDEGRYVGSGVRLNLCKSTLWMNCVFQALPWERQTAPKYAWLQGSPWERRLHGGPAETVVHTDTIDRRVSIREIRILGVGSKGHFQDTWNGQEIRPSSGRKPCGFLGRMRSYHNGHFERTRSWGHSNRGPRGHQKHSGTGLWLASCIIPFWVIPFDPSTMKVGAPQIKA